MCAVVGTWLVLRGMSFFGDALVHGIVPGIALAVLFDVSPFLGAAVAAEVMVAGIEHPMRFARRAGPVLPPVFRSRHQAGLLMWTAGRLPMSCWGTVRRPLSQALRSGRGVTLAVRFSGDDSQAGAELRMRSVVTRGRPRSTAS
jgi:hypothetical protein